MEGEKSEKVALSRPDESETRSSENIHLQNFESIKLVAGSMHPADCNPSLWKREEARLDIEPFPEEILRRINIGKGFRGVEKDGEFVVPVSGLYRCVWDGAPTYLEERSEVWAGAEFGTTIWLNSKPLGTFSSPVNESLLRDLQCQSGPSSNIKAVRTVTGIEYLPAKSSTVGRYIASLATAGDNHITLLTAAYCVLLDRLWW